ncbi:hypothetical protein [Caldifermentibacillus hisashii]|uniref:hypothetical protein n=1 Tax=Caldifermentibacillus hisashii TaxID=996558 RepID=UPI0030E752DF
MPRHIHIAVHYTVNGNRTLRRGSFQVNSVNFAKDEKSEVLRVAKQFIDRIWRENSHRVKIEKVLYNEKDITNFIVKN